MTLDNELDEMAALIASIPWEDRSHQLVLIRKVMRLIELSRQELLLKTLAELVEAMQSDSNHEFYELFKALSKLVADSASIGK